MSKKDYDREQAAEDKYSKAAAKAKSEYKQALKSKKNDAAIANRLYSKQDSKANKMITDMSTGEAILRSSLMGSYGALKYTEAKARGQTTGKAVFEGLIHTWGDVSLGGLLNITQYMDNRLARKK